MTKATIVAFDNFTDIDVFLAWDLLNRIRLIDKNFQVKIVGTKTVHRSVCGIELSTSGIIEECNKADLVFFASGPGTRMLIKDQEYLRRFQLNSGKQLICSMCSGALVLAALGLLEGLSATTYPTAVHELAGMGVKVEHDKHMVIQGNIATAAGCLAAVDLVKWAIERLYDSATADAVIASVLPVGQGQACIY